MNIVVASSGTLLMNLMLAKPLVEGVVSRAASARWSLHAW